MFIIFCEKQNKMPCSFKVVILWSLMHNFWVFGVGSAGKDAFLSPDHIFLLGILITSFNSFCIFFLAGLPVAEEPPPSLGAWKGSQRWWQWPGFPQWQRLDCPAWLCLATSFRPVGQQNLSKVLQPTVVHGKVRGAHRGQKHPLSPSQLQPGCEQLGLEGYFPPAKLAVGMWSSLRTHEGQGLFPPGACLHGWWLLWAGPQCDPALSRAQKGTVPSQKSCRDTATLLGSSLCFSLPKPPPLGTTLSYF